MPGVMLIALQVRWASCPTWPSPLSSCLGPKQSQPLRRWPPCCSTGARAGLSCSQTHPCPCCDASWWVRLVAADSCGVCLYSLQAHLDTFIQCHARTVLSWLQALRTASDLAFLLHLLFQPVDLHSAGCRQGQQTADQSHTGACCILKS